MYHRWLVGTGNPISPMTSPLSQLCLDGGKDVLVREIDAIQELLDEQPDSKCESLLP